MTQCLCFKLDNNQCSRQAKEGSKFCWQHQNCKNLGSAQTDKQVQVPAPPRKQSPTIQPKSTQLPQSSRQQFNQILNMSTDKLKKYKKKYYLVSLDKTKDPVPKCGYSVYVVRKTAGHAIIDMVCSELLPSLEFQIVEAIEKDLGIWIQPQSDSAKKAQKVKHTASYFYMKENLNRIKLENPYIVHSQAVYKAYEEWNNLNADDKKPYEKMAKRT